jgi:hypothetical protein
MPARTDLNDLIVQREGGADQEKHGYTSGAAKLLLIR